MNIMTKYSLLLLTALIPAICSAEELPVPLEPSLVLKIDAPTAPGETILNTYDYPFYLIVRGGAIYFSQDPESIPSEKEIQKYRLEIVRPMMKDSSGNPTLGPKGTLVAQQQSAGIDKDVMFYRYNIDFTIDESDKTKMIIGDQAHMEWTWKYPDSPSISRVNDFSAMMAPMVFKVSVINNTFELKEE